MALTPKSIKGRIFLWFFLWNAFLLLVVSSVIYKQMEFSVYKSVNNVLRSKAEIINSLLKVENNEIKLRLNEFITGSYTTPKSGHYYKVEVAGHPVIASKSLGNPGFNLSGGKFEKENIDLKEKFFTSTGPKKEPIRILQKETEFEGMPVTIYAAEDITVHLEVLANSQWILIMIFPLAIIIFGIGTFWIARLSLKPLEEFSEEVSMITHTNLDKKIVMKNSPKELEGLTFSFNNMLDRIKNAFEVEKFIISEASHKLKTPVTVIKSYCDVILQKEREKAQYIETLESVRRVAKNIANLIKGILSLANLDSGHLSMQNNREISLNNFLLDAIELTKYQGEQKNINFKVHLDNDVKVNGDEDKLTEAFVNIIGNAYKYNNDNGSITVTTSNNCTKTEICIKDTGIGINEDEIDKIFERFYRSESVKNIDGSGLGLKIASRIIESHNGSISVNSKAGEGTEFKIVLPCNNEEIKPGDFEN